MELKAACDDRFLFDSALDFENLYDEWVPLVESMVRRECELFVSEVYWESESEPGCVLNPATALPFKEIRSAVWRLLGRMTPSADPECDGRATRTGCLSLVVGDSAEGSCSCNSEEVDVSYAGNELSVQAFWRGLLGAVNTAAEFESGIEISFWSLEFGPEGRNHWNDTGHNFANIRQSLVDHLSYLNDQAIQDWASAKYNDNAFTKLAQPKGVLLSRDEAAAKGRKYADSSGVDQPCRHHTKLTPTNQAVSARHGGRIYFSVENRTKVLIGKVCEHD